MSYAVICKTNNWNRSGQPTNVRERTVLATADLQAAFACAKARQEAAGHGATYARNAVSHDVVDASGQHVSLCTLFQQMHPHLYEAIEAERDEGVSNLWIDLDGWFAMGCPGLG
jgi:hypothetical protein